MTDPLARCANCRQRHIEHAREGDLYLCEDGGAFEPWPLFCRDDEDPAEFKRLVEKWRDTHDVEIAQAMGAT